jgi:hypothetical protein
MNSWKSTLLSACAPPLRDVHQRDGERPGVGAAKVAVQWQSDGLSGSAGRGQRHSQHGIGAELAFVGGAVEREQVPVKSLLVEGVAAHEAFGNRGIDVGHGLLNALAEVAALIAVAEFKGFVLAG